MEKIVNPEKATDARQEQLRLNGIGAESDIVAHSLHLETATEHIRRTLEEMKLKVVANEFMASLKDMTNNEWVYLTTTLGLWLEKELAQRKELAIAGKIRSAKFRRLQTFDAFDFKHSKTTEKIEKNYRALFDSVARDNLPSAVFSGQAGLGKTHLARALGYGACQKGLSVLFVTCAEMVNHLQQAQKTFNLETELNKYRRPQVLIIDELGYVSLDTQSSNLFFQVISARHDAGLGTIATTNLPFGKFNQIFANDAIAHAIVDRLVNTAEVFYLEGESSYREHQRKQKTDKRKKSAA
jgi:DNA replication protein DnaC